MIAGAALALGWLTWAMGVCYGAALVMTAVPGSENNGLLILAVLVVANVLVWGGFAVMVRLAGR